MAIARASSEIRSAQSTRTAHEAAERAFRERQLAIDELISAVEDVVAAGEPEIPRPLLREAWRLLALVYGTTPPWISDVDSPAALLDHLFIAEGRLRQDYYGENQVDLDDCS